MEEKGFYRKLVKALRRELGEDKRKALSEAIFPYLYESPLWQEARRVYLYVSMPGEVEMRPLIEQAWMEGKQVAVPKVLEGRMVFIEIFSFQELSPGFYGIWEPKGQEEVLWEDALVILPGVAFDKKGHRIGYGGGYYDRYLAAHPLKTLALAFGFQVFEELPSEEADIPAGGLITPEGPVALEA